MDPLPLRTSSSDAGGRKSGVLFDLYSDTVKRSCTKLHRGGNLFLCMLLVNKETCSSLKAF